MATPLRRPAHTVNAVAWFMANHAASYLAKHRGVGMVFSKMLKSVMTAIPRPRCVLTGESCMVCDASCQLVEGATQVCGDVRQENGSCDDHNAVTEQCAYGEPSCMVCDANCQLVAGATQVCGDGVEQGSKGCDDGNMTLESCAYGEMSCEVCDHMCALVSGATYFCGDGLVQERWGEQCDEGSTRLKRVSMVNKSARSVTVGVWKYLVLPRSVETVNYK